MIGFLSLLSKKLFLSLSQQLSSLSSYFGFILDMRSIVSQERELSISILEMIFRINL